MIIVKATNFYLHLKICGRLSYKFTWFHFFEILMADDDLETGIIPNKQKLKNEQSSCYTPDLNYAFVH